MWTRIQCPGLRLSSLALCNPEVGAGPVVYRQLSESYKQGMADREEGKEGREEEEDDPLVIDEEKPTEEGTGNDNENEEEDENEKEFEPTVDMIMNEFDDERTIDEEETMTQEDEADELKALEDEQDIPIEELLKRYGYNKDDAKEATEAASIEAAAATDAAKTDSEPEEISAEPEKTETETSEVGEASVGQGEKRGPGTPPPAKKSRSELAK